MCYLKSVSEQNNNLISYIATTVETMRDQIATKDDLVQMATRIETLRDQMATKDDLARVESNLAHVEGRLAHVEGQMATKEDLLQMATKDDLLQMATKTDVAVIRGDIEQVQIRLDSIDRTQSTRMGLVETEISRLRSVLYLLVKDKPDMLRLLGQPNPGESRPQS